MKKRKSIRIRLLEVYVVIMLLVFAINMYIVHSQSQAIRQIDGVYNSNIQLNDISTTLEKMQTSLYQYLNTKSSDELENYYLYEQDYRNLISELNEETVNDQNLLMEKNIRNMSDTYLEKTAGAIEAKRGRNVSCYNEEYSKAKKLYDYLQSCVRSLNTSVFLENSQNYSVLRSTLNYVVGFSMFLLTVSMLVALAWIVMMTRTITRPLIKLAEAANTIAKGGLEVDFPIIDTGDEISTMAKACNKMMNSIRDYIRQTKENYERESRLIENELIMKNDLKEAQLKYLQAQINPHFLFNTLNTIASFTRTDPLRARELLREFSSFYRATLDNSGSLIPVSREVAQTKRYLTFEKARFGEDRVLATFDVSEDVEDTLVPAFVIQPIVENAVRHGMGDGDALGIDVSVHRDGEDAILIAVADDGVGMDEGTAARLFDERFARPDANSPQGGGAGVAMHNISERIHRFYGPHSYTRVESAPGKGTKVLLHLDLSESIFDIQE